MAQEISQELLEVLVCPLSKGDLVYDKTNQELICYESNLAFKINDGIPNMLIDEARKINNT